MRYDIRVYVLRPHGGVRDFVMIVDENGDHIFAVTAQTSEGTRSTAQMVRELSRTAEELKASVARFKIA